MIFPTNIDKCIICLEKRPLTFEHIIPASIGGGLKSQLQCADCNNRKLGSNLISNCKRESTIRLAIWALRYRLPKLFDSIESGQDYYASGQQGERIPLKRNKTGYTIKTEKVGPAIRYDFEIFMTEFKNRLQKEGVSDEEIKDLRKDIQNAPLDKDHIIGERFVVNKKTINANKIIPKLHSHRVENRVAALIAYNFLSICIGQDIYREEFNPLRDFVLDEKVQNCEIVKQFMTRQYGAFHQIFVERKQHYIEITVILFGWAVYVIKIHNYQFPIDGVLYTDDLEDKIQYFAKNYEELEKGQFWSGSELLRQSSQKT